MKRTCSFGKRVRKDAVPGNFKKGLIGSRLNLLPFDADPFPQSLERLVSSVVVGKLGDIFPQDHLPRSRQMRGLLLAVMGLKALHDLR